MQGHEWMTIREVADLYRRPVKTLYDWRYKSFGPASIRVGGKLLYRRSDVEVWLAEQADAPREAVGDRA